MAYLFLGLAIVAEVIGTTLLKATDGFTRVAPAIGVVAMYVAAAYLLALTVRTLPVGVVYAVWSGAGIVAVALLAWLIYGQALDVAAVAGMALIVAGILVINLFSKTAVH